MDSECFRMSQINEKPQVCEEEAYIIYLILYMKDENNSNTDFFFKNLNYCNCGKKNMLIFMLDCLIQTCADEMHLKNLVMIK